MVELANEAIRLSSCQSTKVSYASPEYESIVRIAAVVVRDGWSYLASD